MYASKAWSDMHCSALIHLRIFFEIHVTGIIMKKPIGLSLSFILNYISLSLVYPAVKKNVLRITLEQTTFVHQASDTIFSENLRPKCGIFDKYIVKIGLPTIVFLIIFLLKLAPLLLYF